MIFYRDIFKIKSLEDLSLLEGIVLSNMEKTFLLCYLIHIDLGSAYIDMFPGNVRGLKYNDAILSLAVKDDQELFKKFDDGKINHNLLAKHSSTNIITYLLENDKIKDTDIRVKVDVSDTIRELYSRYGKNISDVSSEKAFHKRKRWKRFFSSKEEPDRDLMLTINQLIDWGWKILCTRC